MTTTAVHPFRITVPDMVLDDLRTRLARTRFPGEVVGSGWAYGTNLAYLKELVGYWQERYDWRAAEAALNAMPQFTARVRGLQLHFVRAWQGATATASPLHPRLARVILGGAQDPRPAHRSGRARRRPGRRL